MKVLRLLMARTRYFHLFTHTCVSRAIWQPYLFHWRVDIATRMASWMSRSELKPGISWQPFAMSVDMIVSIAVRMPQARIDSDISSDSGWHVRFATFSLFSASLAGCYTFSVIFVIRIAVGYCTFYPPFVNRVVFTPGGIHVRNARP